MTFRLPCGHYLGPAYTITSRTGSPVYHCIVDGREFDPLEVEMENLL